MNNDCRDCGAGGSRQIIRRQRAACDPCGQFIASAQRPPSSTLMFESLRQRLFGRVMTGATQGMSAIGIVGTFQHRARHRIKYLVAGAHVTAADTSASIGGIALGRQAGQVAETTKIDHRPTFAGVAIEQQVRQGSDRSSLSARSQVRSPQIADDGRVERVRQHRWVEQLPTERGRMEHRLAMDHD